jgi:hypothetical protein
MMFLTCQPVLDIPEGLLVSDVVSEDDAVGSFVVGCSDSLESFLPSSVPDLHLD